MSVVSSRRLRSGKIINNSCTVGKSSKIRLNMDSDLNIAVNANSDSNSSKTHQNEVSLNSQPEMKGQIAKLLA